MYPPLLSTGTDPSDDSPCPEGHHGRRRSCSAHFLAMHHFFIISTHQLLVIACRVLHQKTRGQSTQTIVVSRAQSCTCLIAVLLAEPLDRLLKTSRCIRCTAMFKESENADDACHYHPGPSQSYIRNQNHRECPSLCYHHHHRYQGLA